MPAITQPSRGGPGAGQQPSRRVLATPRSSEHRDAFGAKHARERDQRQADERGRVVADDALEQRDAQRFRFHRRRRNRRAPRVRGRRRFPRRPSVRNVLVTSTMATLAAAAAGIDQRQAGVENHRAPGQARAAAPWRRRNRPGLPTGRPSQSATWSEPMTSASANRAATARALASDSRSAVAAGRFAGQRSLVDVAAPRPRRAGASARAAPAGSATSSRAPSVECRSSLFLQTFL